MSMNTPNPSDSGSEITEPSTSERLQDRIQDVSCELAEKGKTCVVQNPITVTISIFLLGLLVGALCSTLSPKKRLPARSKCDVVDDIVARISERLPNLKKQNGWSDSLLGQCQHAGKKLKFW